MSVSDIIIKAIGVILAVVGLLLLLSVIGITSVVFLQPFWLALLVGIILIAIGVYLVRGGSISL